MRPGLRVGIVRPESTSPHSGNQITAQRWQRIIRSLGHNVKVLTGYDGRPFDVLVVLHARRNAAAARLFHARYPERRLIVALTGTDLYVDLPRRASVRRTLALADRLVLLQPEALRALTASERRKARVVYQSVAERPRPARRRTRRFEIVVVAGLRRVKDPLRAAYAARLLPAASRVRVTCVGPALDPSYERRVRIEARRNSRFRWIGAVSPRKALGIIAAADALVLSSRSEGGANVIGEAIAAGTPVLCTRIAGSIGLLGKTYAGYFDVGDTRALAVLMSRVELDAGFRARLRRAGTSRAGQFDPARERAAWKALLET